MRSKFSGVGVALITPFNQDLSVDFVALGQLIDLAIDGKSDYLVVNGTTSEASTIEVEEKDAILRFIIERNRGRLPIMYGIGANNTKYVLDLINKTDFSSIDAILTVSPYYNRPSQEGIFQHYTAIADKSPVPVVLYNVPGRTGSNMTAETTIRLAAHSNIIGIKEACGDFEQWIKIATRTPDDFLLISGDDMAAVPMISLGGQGAISVLANAYPLQFGEMIHAALDGNYNKASQILEKFIDVNGHLYTESNPVGIKEVLKNLGLCQGNVRLPLVSASQELHEKIVATMPEFAVV